jgi:predicted secreted protein
MADHEKMFALAMIISILAIHTGISQADIIVCTNGCNFNSINEAINEAQPDDTIRVLRITNNESLVLNKTLTLRGLIVDGQRPILKPDNGCSVIIAADGVTLRGFMFLSPTAKNRGKNCSILSVNSKGNWIYLNDFADRSGICSGSTNSWNSSQTIKYQYNSKTFSNNMGNYWSNYSGSDKNGDGIGDQPKVLDANNVDYYPLMKPSEGYVIDGERLEAKNIVQAKLNKPFNIALDSNPTTGYRWTVDFNYRFLMKGNESYSKSQPELIGSGGQQIFTFTPIRDGQTIISAVYKRPWEDIVVDERTFSIIVFPISHT